tara:strand:- start:638 stop:928 length:291 start_codon:yes stop_codon:yes gene_type:complete
MYKNNKSMDFCRTGKAMMDYGSKKVMKDYGSKKDKAMMDAKANLLKAVPNQEAYNKLSEIEKAEFNKAAKKAGLPMKPAPEGQDSAKYRGNEDEID